MAITDFVKSGVGIYTALFAAFFLSIQSFIIKKRADVPFFYFFLFRGVFQFLISLSLIASTGSERRIELDAIPHLPMLFLRGFFTATGVQIYYFVLSHISITVVSALAQTRPFMAAIFAYLFLKQSLNRYQILLMIFALIGALFVVQPFVIFSWIFGGDMSMVTTNENSAMLTFYCCLTLLATLLTAVGICITNFLGKDVHHYIIILTTATTYLILSVISLFLYNVGEFPCDLSAILWLCIFAIFGVFFQILITISLTHEKPALVSCIMTTELPFAVIWDYFFIGEDNNFLAYIGMGIILISVLGISILPEFQKRYKCTL